MKKRSMALLPAPVKNLIVFGCLVMFALGLPAPTSADVFVNRELLPPTPTDPCPFAVATLMISSTVTWDSGFQNAWGACVGLPPGPPFVMEFQGTGVQILLGGSLEILGPGTVSLLGSQIATVNGSLSAIGITFTSTFVRPIHLGGYLSVVIEDCVFDISTPPIGVALGGVAIGGSTTMPAATLQITGTVFNYSGAPVASHVFLSSAGSVEISGSHFTAIDGAALDIRSVADLTLHDNHFEHVSCALLGSGGGGVLCGLTVSIGDTAIRSMGGNTGSDNFVNGITVFGSARTISVSTWSTTAGFPLVVSRSNIFVSPGTTLDLSAGTIFKLGGMDPPSSIFVQGTLTADGVVFTSLQDNSIGGTGTDSGFFVSPGTPPSPGDWGSLSVANDNPAFPPASATIAHSEVRFGGGAGLIFQGDRGSLTVTDSTLTRSSAAGLLLQSNTSSADVQRNVIRDNVGPGVHVSSLGPVPSVIEANLITGNADGIVNPFLGNFGSTPVLSRNMISGNRGNGIVFDGVPLIVNNVIAANALDGIVQNAIRIDPARILNNTIFGNGGHGIRVPGTAFSPLTPPEIVNNLVTDNMGFGIFEDVFFDTPLNVPRFNNLFGNGAGLFGKGTSSGGISLSLAEINGLPGAAGNISADPLFPVLAAGTSTTTPSFDPAIGTSTLDGSFVPGALVGLTVNPDLSQRRRFLIIANSATAITALGDMTLGGTLLGGEAYTVLDLLPFDPASPVIDAGEDRADLGAVDFAGAPRVTGLSVDIGALEFNPPPASADLSIVKAVQTAPAQLFLGSPLSYGLTVHNLGPDPAPNVLVTDTLPAGVTFVSAAVVQGSGTCSGTSTITCALGPLPPGGPATEIQLVVTPTALGPLSNTASVASDVADPLPADNTSTADAEVRLCGDLDGDSAVGRADRTLVRAALGSCEGEARFNPLADLDGDTCITHNDYRLWYGCYLDFLTP